MEQHVLDIYLMMQAYGFQTFEVHSSRLKPGYAESAIVNGLLDLINEATH